MIKTLTKHGNSLALVIDRAILDLLRIDVETRLDISTDGRALIITPVSGSQPSPDASAHSGSAPAQPSHGDVAPAPRRGSRVLGLHPGNMVMSADFDEPLADAFWLGAT